MSERKKERMKDNTYQNYDLFGENLTIIHCKSQLNIQYKY